MSAYPIKEIIKLWKAGKITQEQAIGQILLLLQEAQKRLDELENRESERRRRDEEVNRARR
jgi:hypothetical protein